MAKRLRGGCVPTALCFKGNMARGPPTTGESYRRSHYWAFSSVIFNWDVVDRRPWLSVAFICYLAVQVSTVLYLVPEQEGLIKNADSLDRKFLQSRADKWIGTELLSELRGTLLARAFTRGARIEPRRSHTER